MTPPARIGYYRWVICALLFFATTINYVDRQVIGILKSTLQGEFGWNEIDYSNIVFAFQTAYAIGLMLAGRLMDKVGTKAGYAIALIVWSLAAVACAEATAFGPVAASLLATVGFVATPSVAGFMAARFALGLGEGGNFPGRDQERRRVVPEARARAGHRDLQLGHQRRRRRRRRWWCRGSPCATDGTGRLSSPARSGFSG